MKKRIIFILVAVFIISSILPISAATLDSVRHNWGCDWDNAYYTANHNTGSSQFITGDSSDGNIIREHWEPIYVNRGTPYTLYANAYSNGGFLRMTGMSSLVCLDQWQGDWEFSMLANCDLGTQRFAGMVIRADREADGTPVHNVYEIAPDHDSSMGPIVGDSGIGISFSNYGEDFVTLYIITRDDKGYSSIYHQEYYEVNGIYGAFSNAAWGKIRVTDSNGRLSLYVNDELSIYVEYSNLVDGHYTKAVIYDAKGTEMDRTEEAWITADANIALGSSNAAFNIDQIMFKDPTSNATPTPTPTIDPNKTPSSTATAAPTAPATQKKVISMYNTSFDRTGVLPLYTAEVAYGFKFTVESGNSLDSIILKSMATNGAYETSFTVFVYKWYGDYDESIFQDPVYYVTVEDHIDNANCIIDFPEDLGCGHYLVVVTEATTGVDVDGNQLSTGFPLLWKSEMSEDDSIIVFENGFETDYGLFVDCVTIVGGDPDGVVEDVTAAPSTKAPTSEPQNTDAATTAPTTAPSKNEKNGCGSSSAIAQVMLLMGCALIIKRKAN
ncbi:MAG: hypothetical protein E7385_03430 [Ruminococcaceae bacterium]|nr:hypothetical protein [Oscillospiraceae bacterium]